MLRIGFIGGGKIAQAMAKGFIASGKMNCSFMITIVNMYYL